VKGIGLLVSQGRKGFMTLQRYDDWIRPELDGVSFRMTAGNGPIVYFVEHMALVECAAVNGAPTEQSDEKLFERYRELVERAAAAKHAAGHVDCIIRVDDLLEPP
jgi:hypothetical protein